MLPVFDDADNASNGALASAVLGQVDFVTLAAGTPNPTAAAFGPIGLAVDATGALWVTDLSNRRALRFDQAASKGNGANADAVLGQVDFVSKVTAPPTITPTATNLSGSFGLAVDATGALWIADTSNNRVLHYTPQPDSAPAAAIALAQHGKKKILTSAARLTIKGTAACPDGVARVEYRVGKKGGFKTAGGTTGWSFKAALKPGKNTITIHAFGVTGAEATTTAVVIRE